MTHVCIDEVDKNNHVIKEMWWLEKNGSEKKFVTKYGVPPEGWKEDKHALPLELNKIYEVTGDYYFAIYKHNNRIKSGVSKKLEKVYKVISK